MNSAGRYKPYPAYKDSGVEWLGEVPEGWEVSRIRFIVSTPVTDGPHETPEILDEGVPFVSAEAIFDGKVNFNKIRGYISEEDHQKYSRKYLPKKGDIYMVKSGATTGRIAIVETEEEFNIWSPLAAIRCRDSIVNRYYAFYYLQSTVVKSTIETSWNFGTQQNIGMGVIQNFRIPTPPLPEQTAIAAFLDRETGRIDALIAKKKRLIELLAEKRAAVISHAVTKGLDPDAPMKDSGVEWLGEVPEHWEVLHLKQVFSDVIYGISEVADVEGNFEMLTMGDINEGVVTCPQKRFVDHVDRKLLLRDGDLLFNRTNSLDLIGKVGVFEGGDNVTFASYLVRLRFTDDSTPYYFNYLLNTPTILARARVVALPSIGQANLNPNRYGYIVVCKPPKSEQIQIVQYLENEVEKLKSLITKNQAAIAKLQEYRTALITAAVTGKIDVREETEA